MYNSLYTHRLNRHVLTPEPVYKNIVIVQSLLSDILLQGLWIFISKRAIFINITANHSNVNRTGKWYYCVKDDYMEVHI